MKLRATEVLSNKLRQEEAEQTLVCTTRARIVDPGGACRHLLVGQSNEWDEAGLWKQVGERGVG